MANHLENTKKILQSLKSDLASRYHVDTIGLFGSIVRDDFVSDTSDVDIVVSFSQPVGVEFIDLSYLLEKKLNKKVDIVSLNGLKKKYFKEIEKEIVYV